MLRFGNRNPPAATRRFASQSRGVWMLLLMLGAVMVLMRQMQQPETVAHLQRVFAPASQPRAGEERIALAARQAAGGDLPGEATAPKPNNDGAWAAVKDNALFLPAEREAWFLLWEETRRHDPSELSRQAIADVTYAQLVNQPDVYRGQPVRVRGRILRESPKPAPNNALGIAEYHQLVLAPVGGGDWPVVLYCLELPPGFPRGRDLKVDVTFAGLFFKNWSYPYDGGMGLAPVLIAKTLAWEPARIAPIAASGETDARFVWWGAGAAFAAAIAFVLWAWTQTRRPMASQPRTPDFQNIEAES